MISQEDYNFILAYDNAVGNPEKRNAILREHGHQCAKTFLNLLGHICKDQTIQYLLILIEDMLTVRVRTVSAILVPLEAVHHTGSRYPPSSTLCKSVFASLHIMWVPYTYCSQVIV